MKPKLKLFLILLLFTITYSSAQVVIKQIQPSATDLLISTFDTDHYIYLNQNVASNNLLLVHLPGSYGKPNKATLFGSHAANLGFHCIGLSYPNIPTVASICSNSPDQSCYENLRREIITGIDYSEGISVDTTESILNRVKKLLVYLKTNYSSEDWGQFLDTNNDVIFSKIIFSGHSQGGGHAALIAKDYPIKRALCFSSPKDYGSFFNAPASWLHSDNWQTPGNEIYAFVHTLDFYGRQLKILDSLGLGTYGLPVNVDNFSSPYNNTLQLITSYSVTIGNEHGSTISDNKTPMAAGSPVFLPVWSYMLTNRITTDLRDDFIFGKTNHKVYPNPTNGLLNFRFDVIPKNLEISIFTILGERILTAKNKTEINLSHLTNGVYFIKINADNKIKTEKIFKTK
jgi:hypothetical protein